MFLSAEVDDEEPSHPPPASTDSKRARETSKSGACYRQTPDTRDAVEEGLLEEEGRAEEGRAEEGHLQEEGAPPRVVFCPRLSPLAACPAPPRSIARKPAAACAGAAGQEGPGQEGRAEEEGSPGQEGLGQEGCAQEEVGASRRVTHAFRIVSDLFPFD